MNLRKLLSLIVCGTMIATAGVLAITNGARTSILHAQHDHDLVHYDAVEATEEHPGNIEYWVCCGCHKSFSDSGALNEIPNTDVSAGKTHIVEGDGRYVPALNVQRNLNSTFELSHAETAPFAVPCNDSFSVYPYGQWANREVGVESNNEGITYYIQGEPGNESNMVIKQPANATYPRVAEVKKDLSANTAAIGTYEVSFDVKVSQKAYESNNGAGAYGNIVGYMWCDDFIDLGSIARTNTLSTTEWTNLRVRYTSASVHTYNQLNLRYWLEGYVGDDNYILIDNIQIFAVNTETGLAIETNIDTIPGGDLEIFNPSNPLKVRNEYIVANNETIGRLGIMEDNGEPVLKMAGPTASDGIRMKLSDTLATNGGTYRISIDVKKGPASQMTAINLCYADIWNWRATPFNTSSVVTDQYTTLSEIWTFESYPDRVGNLWMYFCVDKSGPSTSPDDYVLIDNISIQRVYLD